MNTAGVLSPEARFMYSENHILHDFMKGKSLPLADRAATVPAPEIRPGFPLLSGLMACEYAPPGEGTLLGLQVTPAGLSLLPDSLEGCFTSHTLRLPPFDRLVPYWSASVSGSGSVAFHVQVWTGRSWSMWYPLGTWALKAHSHEGKDEWGRVDTDTLTLKTPHTLFRYRACLSRAAISDPAPVLSRTGFTARPFVEEPSGDFHPVAGTLPDADVLVHIPCRSQMVEPPEIASRICSPTSLAMAMQKFGIKRSTVEVAERCHDSGAMIYGNWSFNVAALAEYGLSGRLAWFSAFDKVLAELRSGKPVIASIRFGENSLDGAPIRRTSGHLVVVRGLVWRSGMPYAAVNDPAAPDADTVAREYSLDQFLAAWRGLVYIVDGPEAFA